MTKDSLRRKNDVLSEFLANLTIPLLKIEMTARTAAPLSAIRIKNAGKVVVGL